MKLPSTAFVLLTICFASSARAEPVSFIRDVAPILVTRCAGCHGDKKAEGDYRLHKFEFLSLAGASGTNAVVAGKPEESELLRRLKVGDEAERMPQEDEPLADEQIELIRRWIAEGARFDGRDLKLSIKSQLPPRTQPKSPEHYGHPAPIFALAYTPDGTEIAASGHHEILVWSAVNGKLLRRLPGLPQRIQSLAYNRAGSWLLVGGGSPGDYGELLLVDPNGKTPPRSIAMFDDLVLGATWSRHEKWFAAASADRSVRAFDAAGRPRWESRLHSDWATAVSFSHDDRFLASSSRDCTVKVLAAETGKLFTTFNGHQMQYGDEVGRFEVNDVTFAPDSPLAFSLGKGRAVRVWEPEKAQAESGDARDMEERFRKPTHARFPRHDSKRPAFKIALAGGQAFIATGDGPVKQFDAATLQPVRDLAGQSAWVFSVSCHAPSQRVAAGAYGGEICIWNTQTGELVTRFTAAP